MARVRYQNVVKKFDTTPVIKDLSLEINDKEFVVFVGPSGCGKSTSLRLLAGLEELTSGNIYIGDKIVNKISPRDRDIAMVFQTYALYPHMNVFNNMAFGLKLRKISKEEIKRRVTEAAEILDLGDLLKRKPRQLSGGQRQRVAVGRAIVRKPQVFLMDEPLSNLDAQLRVQARTEISALQERLEATIVYVTHDQVEAMTMGDRIAIFNEGILHQFDKPSYVYEKPVDTFVAKFIGSPSMNFFDGQVKSEDNKLFIDLKGSRLPIPDNKKAALEKHTNKQVIFGIRPEHAFVKGTSPQELAGKAEVKAKISIVELLGKESYLFAENEAGKITLIYQGAFSGNNGDEITVEYDMNKMHLFDKDTEIAIQ